MLYQRRQVNVTKRKRNSIFGLQGSVPAHEALHLAVNTRACHRPDVRPEWKCPRGRPDILGSASWRSMSGLLQMLLGTWPVIATSGGRNDPVNCQAVQWVSECVREIHGHASWSLLRDRASNWRRITMVSIQKLSCVTSQKLGYLPSQTGNFAKQISGYPLNSKSSLF